MVIEFCILHSVVIFTERILTKCILKIAPKHAKCIMGKLGSQAGHSFCILNHMKVRGFSVSMIN